MKCQMLSITCHRLAVSQYTQLRN